MRIKEELFLMRLFIGETMRFWRNWRQWRQCRQGWIWQKFVVDRKMRSLVRNDKSDKNENRPLSLIRVDDGTKNPRYISTIAQNGTKRVTFWKTFWCSMNACTLGEVMFFPR
jgi:hypothetical protein